MAALPLKNRMMVTVTPLRDIRLDASARQLTARPTPPSAQVRLIVREGGP
jgi:hypothetical protein